MTTEQSLETKPTDTVDPASFRHALREVLEGYDEVFLIVSPPRCSSTAVARVFWEQPSVRSYLHEPFDLIYHRKTGLDEVLEAFAQPLEVSDAGTDLIIKEMTFQVGDLFEHLLEVTKKPVVFMIRDPRQSLWSRMKRLRLGGQDPVFPERESGWEDLERQLDHCRANDVPFFILDSTTFRNQPEAVFSKLFAAMDLPYSPEMLHWDARQSLALGQLEGEQDNWYSRVLSSTGIQPARVEAPAIDEFPRELQPHLEECLALYRRLLDDERLIAP